MTSSTHRANHKYFPSINSCNVMWSWMVKPITHYDHVT